MAEPRLTAGKKPHGLSSCKPRASAAHVEPSIPFSHCSPSCFGSHGCDFQWVRSSFEKDFCLAINRPQDCVWFGRGMEAHHFLPNGMLTACHKLLGHEIALSCRRVSLLLLADWTRMKSIKLSTKIPKAALDHRNLPDPLQNAGDLNPSWGKLHWRLTHSRVPLAGKLMVFWRSLAHYYFSLNTEDM